MKSMVKLYTLSQKTVIPSLEFFGVHGPCFSCYAIISGTYAWIKKKFLSKEWYNQEDDLKLNYHYPHHWVPLGANIPKIQGHVYPNMLLS